MTNGCVKGTGWPTFYDGTQALLLNTQKMHSNKAMMVPKVLPCVNNPSSVAFLQECPPDEVFKCCGPCYQLNCYGTVLDCAGRCYAECYCASGFVREYPGGRCIPKLFCQRPPLPILSDYEDLLVE
uniref:TIL domain-containing protein n=1 Tax=Anopheles melas TaxID=34690 RepID=A0A182TRY0_9DIPT